MTKFINKKSCFIGKNVKFGKNVTIYENNHIDGNSYIGDNCIIYPNNFINNCYVDNNCKIYISFLEDSFIKRDCIIGPFARLRPNSNISENCKIGNFVEVKNSKIGNGTKASHLSYIGDSELGENCNIGCGVIFVNYNGKEKQHIKIGNHVFVGSNCNLIAPIEIADDSFICAGTTVTENTQKGDFVIGRVRQEIKHEKAKKYW